LRQTPYQTPSDFLNHTGCASGDLNAMHGRFRHSQYGPAYTPQNFAAWRRNRRQYTVTVKVPEQ
jgi:hypothetical protein